MPRAPDPFFRPPNEQELAILDRIARGDKRAAIGRHVYLTVNGVGWHLKHLRDVWQLRSTWQLLILAGQLGWAKVPNREHKQPRRGSGEGLSAVAGRVAPGASHPWRGEK